jgi:hypothetical protein
LCGNPHFFDSFHTYGFLTTTDGSTAIETCGYIDHVLIACSPMRNASPSDWCTTPAGTVNQAGCFGQKDILAMIVGDDGGAPIGDVHVWLESIRVWSCPAWNTGSGGPKISVPGTNTCYGTIISSENAVKGDQKKLFAEAAPRQRQQLAELKGIAQ